MANNSGKRRAAVIREEVDEVLRTRQKKKAAAAPTSSQRSSSPGFPSQAEHEHRELAEAHRRLEGVQRGPLADRKEAQASFLEAMRNEPDRIAERIGWLIDGHCGYGAMLLAKRVLASPRMNRPAALTQMIGSFEWQSPEDLSRAAWKKLTAGEKDRLERAVQGAIAGAASAE